MNMDELKFRVAQGLPVFYYEDEVKVIGIIEVLEHVEIEFNNGEKEIIDCMLLRDNSTNRERGIPLSLFVSFNK